MSYVISYLLYISFAVFSAWQDYREGIFCWIDFVRAWLIGTIAWVILAALLHAWSA